MRRFLVVSAAVWAAGCLNGPTAPEAVALGASFDVKVGASAELPDGFRIKFDRVSADSRCPENVQCVTAGDATVAVLVSSGGNNPFPLDVHTAAPGSQISYSNHTIRLTALRPIPRTDRQISLFEYVATLVVNTP
jgi:hypothetical protein